MRITLPIAALAALAAYLPADAQLRREPLIVATPFSVLNPAGSPIEIAEGSLALATPAPQSLRVRSKEPMLPLTGVIVRIAAGPFDDGMVTYRLQMAELRQSDKSPVSPDPAGWTVRQFLPVPGDARPDLSRVGRHTRFVVTVEQVTDITGRMVFDNSDAREQLWRALGGR